MMAKGLLVALVAGLAMASGGLMAHVEMAIEEVAGRVELWNPDDRMIRLNGVDFTIVPGAAVVDRAGQPIDQAPQIGQRVRLKSQGGTVFEIVIDVSAQGRPQ